MLGVVLLLFNVSMCAIIRNRDYRLKSLGKDVSWAPGQPTAEPGAGHAYLHACLPNDCMMFVAQAPRSRALADHDVFHLD